MDSLLYQEHVYTRTMFILKSGWVIPFSKKSDFTKRCWKLEAFQGITLDRANVEVNDVSGADMCMSSERV